MGKNVEGSEVPGQGDEENERSRLIVMKRNLDGIYMRVKRDGKYQPICLSDMTKEELEEALNPERGEWLKGAVIHLSQCLHEIGDQFGIVNVEVDE